MALVDPAHPLANVPVLHRLTGGALEGMTGDAYTTVVSGALASTTAGTYTYVREALASTPTSARITAIVKADATAGRRSMFGFTNAPATAGSTATAVTGYVAGQGILLMSDDARFATVNLAHYTTLTDGQEYRVTLTYENAGLAGGAQNARLTATVTDLAGDILSSMAYGWQDVRWDPATRLPLGIMARTNSPLGTIRDLTYVGSLFGVADDGGIIRTWPHENDGTSASNRVSIWGTGTAAPIRAVITAGGSGTYGGTPWGQGSTATPLQTVRQFWVKLAQAGYTILSPVALHEGWGADDHLAMQLQALDRLQAAYGAVEVYYVAWSMGGFSAWRSILGNAGYPPIEAAYIVAGGIDLAEYRGIAMFDPGIEARWGLNPATDDSPIDHAGAEYIATGTRVLLAHGDADTGVTKADTHDVMKAKYAGSDLFSEHVYAGEGHYSPVYWDATAAAEVVEFFGAVPDPDPDPSPTEPPEVIPPPESYIPEVIVAGVEADTTRIRIASDTPAHLGIPPRGGHIAGAEADLEWEWPADASTQAEQPWSGDYRPTPGAPVHINVPGPDGLPFRAFTGEIEQTRVSLSNVPLRSTCSDPLARTQVTFSAPSLVFTMPIPPNTNPAVTLTPDDRLHVGAASTWYVERALDALGSRSTVPVTPLTVWHQSMAGSAWPRVGQLTTCLEWNGAAGVVPTNSKLSFENLSDDQRLGAIAPYCVGTTEPYFTSTAPWTIAHEVDPDGTDDYWLRVHSTTDAAGFGLHVTATSVLAVTTDSAGTETTRATMPRTGTTRALVRYDGVGTIEAVSDADPGTVHSVALSVAALDANTAAVTVRGTGTVGALSVWRDGDPLATETATTWPRKAALHISPLDSEQWRLLLHPPIVGERAIDWLAQRSQAEQALLWTDPLGITHWSEVRGFDDLPVSGTITDAVVTGGDAAGVVGLDDLTYNQRRRDEVSLVRVKGKRGSTSYNYTARPNQVAIAATETINIPYGSAPVEMWLERDPETIWFGPLQTDMRRAGEPTSESWHLANDFLHRRGSWWGGFIRDNSDAVLRWATDDDMSVTVEEVGPDSVLVTFTPGIGMVAGETFVNLPAPTSPGLAEFPEVTRQPLPILNAWATSPVIDIEGTSAPIGATAMPEYVHDAGFAASFVTGTRTPTALAEDLAHRHVNHVGEVYVRTEAADVRIGQRWTVEVTSVANLTFDAVVIGVPTLEASAGQASMELRLWVLSVVAPDIPDPEPEPEPEPLPDPIIVDVVPSSNATATLSTAPIEGDVLIVAFYSTQQTTADSISGAGATWTRVEDYPGVSTATSSVTHDIWVGTGATTTGPVAVTSASSHRGMYLVHLRDATAVVDASQSVSTTASSLDGPSVEAGQGKVVLDFLAAPYGFPRPNLAPITPATGWTVLPSLVAGSYGYIGLAHRLPTTTELHQTGTTFNGAGEKRITRILVGGTA